MTKKKVWWCHFKKGIENSNDGVQIDIKQLLKALSSTAGAFERTRKLECYALFTVFESKF